MTPKRPGPSKGHPNFNPAKYPARVELKLTEDQKARVLRAGPMSKVIRALIDQHLLEGGEDANS